MNRRGLLIGVLAPALALMIASSGCSRRADRAEVSAWYSTIQRLEAERDSLHARATELVAADSVLSAMPPGNLVLSVPTSFVRGVIERVFADVVDNVTLNLGGIKARVAKPVKKIVTIGEFVLDVELHEVVARLEPGQPDIVFGNNKVSLSLPVNVVEGHGIATLHFVWDGKRLADVVCGDLDVTKKVSGEAIPATYVLSGGMSLAVRDNDIICTPEFPETRIRIQMKPSQAAWDTVHALLAEKGGTCGFVLDKVNVPKLLEGIVQEKGINVRLPVDRIRPFALPAGVQDSVTIGSTILTFDTRTNVLRIDPDAIWYSADVEVSTMAAPDSAEAGSPDPVD